MSLPEDFLTQLKEYEELSQRERDVFLEMFGHGKSRVQVAQYLNISESALSTCLTGIYKKFRISGSGPIKENRLREYLTKRCLQPKSSGFSTPDDLDRDIDTLVLEIREKVKPNIREQCGKMRVLDMNQPIELTGERGIYTNVNILEKITGRRRLEIAELLLQNCDPENFERFGLNRVSEKRVPGLEAVQRYSKLMVLGKPGAGKTTFLKYLAMQCIEGQFQANRVPLFITLKDFAEAPKKPDLLEYIAQQLSGCEIIDASVKAEQLLRHGRALVLLDGLDEVRDEDNSQVIRQIREFAAQLRDNNIVITCRIAAREYVFKQFTEVEVADFDDQQISTFATQWFQVRKPTKIDKFFQKLEENQPIKELATNPLLLTLLCLIFEEKGKFKNNRTELYEEGIELLLEKWDDSRDIEREQIYRNLPTRRKEDLLSKIALTTFTAGNYFFKNRDTEQLISEYIYNLPDAKTEQEALYVDSKKVLKLQRSMDYWWNEQKVSIPILT
jgi:predicted NACHT family NTPase/DNA-binding CsgD family transcriptional regulator